jgi:hypothetical protein
MTLGRNPDFPSCILAAVAFLVRLEESGMSASLWNHTSPTALLSREYEYYA